MRVLANIVVSVVARVEVPAAIWRKHRIGELTPSDASILTWAFEWDWFGDKEHDPVFAVVALTDDILEAAAQAAAVHGLRAYDAIQLSSAVAARAADPDLDRFACFDEDLTAAARIEGFHPLDA